MFLPIFAIAVKCGYVMLNKNAKDSYSGSYDYQSTTTLTNYLVDFNESSVVDNGGGTFSYFDLNNMPIGFSTIQFNSRNYGGVLLYANDFENKSQFTINVNHSFDFVLVIIRHYVDYYVNIYFYTGTFDDYDWTGVTNYVQPSGYVDSLSGLPYISNGDLLGNFSITNSHARFFINSRTSVDRFFYNNFIFPTYVYDNTLSSVFYGALQELDNVEFFSWAKNSFLAQPFMYIGNLFGIPNVHPIFTFLSYWMAISVIWLVFDVFMYVPLLAHKWIDKGKVD